jgi:hypothetical protein
MKLFRPFAYVLAAASLSVASAGAENTVPTKLSKPQFQSDYFGEMARSFCTIREVDLKGRALVVLRDKDSATVRVPIKDDTELRFRDSWGELENFFPGQHVMLFIYVDEDRNWTFPRAVQDDIQVSAFHGWYAAVTAIDAANHMYATHREEKDKSGKVTKVVDKQILFDPAVKVWKGKQPAGIESLKVGDEVIQQTVEKDGKLVAVEILDRKGDAAVRAVQEERHRKDQDRLGLAAYVNDIEVLTGSLTISVAWSGADRAKTLKPGDVIALTPTDGSHAFAGAVVSNERVDSRQKFRLAINSRVASRLGIGQSLRLFMPGTGPEIPTGKSGVPESAFK